MPTSRPTTNDDIRSSVQRVIDKPDDQDNVKAMVAAFKNTNLTEINLVRSDDDIFVIDDRVAVKIGSAVAEANKGKQDVEKIKSLNFFGQEIKSAESIQALTKDTGIESLNLNTNQNLTIEALSALANSPLKEVKISSTSLASSTSLGGFEDEEKTQLMTEFAKSKSIERLDLRFNNLSDENLKPLLDSKTLKSVSLDERQCSNKMREDLESITKDNRYNKWLSEPKQVERFNKKMSNLARRVGLLEELGPKIGEFLEQKEIHRNVPSVKPLKDEQINDDIRMSVQRVIDFPNNTDNVKAMNEAFRNANLSEIDLSRRDEGELRINDRVAAQIGSAVAEANKDRQDGDKIKSLNFSGQEIKSAESIQALTKDTGIESLNLNVNPKLTFDALSALAKSPLKEVKISPTSLGDFDDGQKTQLMTEFAKSKSIERLDLRFNNLSDENLKPLLDSKTLKSVSLDERQCSNKMRGKLQKMTYQNQLNKKAFEDWKTFGGESAKTWTARTNPQSSSRGR